MNISDLLKKHGFDKLTFFSKYYKFSAHFDLIIKLEKKTHTHKMGLGEPRKRVKYSIDPNALSWANGNF